MVCGYFFALHFEIYIGDLPGLVPGFSSGKTMTIDSAKYQAYFEANAHSRRKTQLRATLGCGLPTSGSGGWPKPSDANRTRF
jgi:hypothetical protein